MHLNDLYWGHHGDKSKFNSAECAHHKMKTQNIYCEPFLNVLLPRFQATLSIRDMRKLD